MAYLPTVRSFVDICGVSKKSIHLPGGMTPAMGYPHIKNQDFSGICSLWLEISAGNLQESLIFSCGARTPVDTFTGQELPWPTYPIGNGPSWMLILAVCPPKKKKMRYSGFRNLALLGEMLSGKWSILWGWLWQQFPTGYIYITTGIYGGFFKWRYPQMVGL